MSCRINIINKKTGITYVYESESYWNKEKQQARNKRVCIGKLSEDNKTLIPSKRLNPLQAAARDPEVKASATIVGSHFILDVITQKLGLDKLLKTIFPQFYRQIQLMAYYLVAYGGALSRCEAWCKSHAPEEVSSLTSQRISEILKAISLNDKQRFCNAWMDKILEDDYLCYDITSISSYSEANEHVRYGYNRDKEQLPQINLAMLYGQKGHLPVYYQSLSGNITDVTTLHNLLKTFKLMEINGVHYIMDKGFYSQKNIDDLLVHRAKFTLSVPLSNKWLQKIIDDIHQEVHRPQDYKMIEEDALYVHSERYSWGSERRRCYVHLFFNPVTRANTVNRFNRLLVVCREELESGKLNRSHQSTYDEFFIIKETPKRGRKVTYNDEAVNLYINRYAGFQALLSNAIKDPVEAIIVYRNKDVVEKCFDDLKNQLDMNRLRIHSSETMNGRLFIQFIALIYISALRKEMRASHLVREYTVRELFQEMESMVKIKYSGKYGYILTELTKQQREILNKLNIQLPVDKT